MHKLVRSEDGLHFGFIVGGKFKECTNFGIELLYCIETNLPTGPGYIARVTRATDKVSGETLKTLTDQILKGENWDKVCDQHEGAEEFLSFTGNISTAEGRERFSKFIETTTTKEKSNTYISIKIFNNSEEITDRIKEIAKKYSVLIEKELKQTIFIEE